MRIRRFQTLLGVLSTVLLVSTAVFAQDAPTGKLKVHVDPGEAYTFVDGIAYGPGQHTIKLAAGDHQILIANYGFTFHQETVSLEPHGRASMDVKLESKGGLVSGPRGRIQLEPGGLNAGDDAVLLNGQTPAYFVGHVDEFNNNILAKQELIVAPGNYLVTVTTHGKVAWSGKVEVGANQRVIVWLKSGKQRVSQWDRGTKLGDVRRFKAGIASATIEIAPVTGIIAANPTSIDCNQSSQLTWNSTETIDADISGFSPVAMIGEKTVSPKQTTTYEFTATGPGGVIKSNATLQVNPAVTSTLTASPMEVRYRRVGDKVLVQDSTTLNWSTTNTDAASIAPLGSVATTGTQSVQPVPVQTTYGPVNEDVNYTLTASNACGGSERKTVAVHVTGSIDPESIPGLALQSVYFPTDYPRRDSPAVGLLDSQRQTLATLATGFTEYLKSDPDAKLTLVGNTDPRGTSDYNMSLGERRVQIVKEYLVSQGISAVSSEGKEQPLDPQAVAQLETNNPEPAPAGMTCDTACMQLAYQRRVDIVLLPANTESKRFYPNAAPDSALLWQRPSPPVSAIEKDQ
jgi:outer membrane protein OmpA-like peptidoglycan-associated protein